MRGEKVYEYTVQITGVTDFGVTAEAILSGQTPVPPQGARFDFSFDGRAQGKIAGRIHGIDYFHMRADGRAELNIRGVIETDDGHRISLVAGGITTPRADGAAMDLVETVELTTASPEYAWVNTRPFWAIGTSTGGSIHIEVYQQ